MSIRVPEVKLLFAFLQCSDNGMHLYTDPVPLKDKEKAINLMRGSIFIE